MPALPQLSLALTAAYLPRALLVLSLAFRLGVLQEGGFSLQEGGHVALSSLLPFVLCQAAS